MGESHTDFGMKDEYKYFKIEAEELLENLTKGLLALEKQPHNPEIVKELFRCAHTLKGAANVVKLPCISELAHKIEDRLSLFRDQKKKAAPDDISLLLEGITTVSLMVEALKNGRPDDTVDSSRVLDKLGGTGAKSKEDDGLKEKEHQNSNLTAVSDPPPGQAAFRAKEAPIPQAVFQRQESIRIKTEDMDQLTNLSNEILINHLRLKDIVVNLRGIANRFGSNGFSKLQLQTVLNELEQGVDQSDILAKEINDTILAARLVMVEGYAFLFEKAVRDLAFKTGKKVDFSWDGGDLLLDRSLMEQIKEPIYHMLRNSVIHGLENKAERGKRNKSPSGTIVLTFEKHGDIVRITCQDDGRGLDPQKIKEIAIKKNVINPQRAGEMSDEDVLYLILESGFSSAEMLTELSGRGVGLDVVKNCITAMGGRLEIASHKREFTRFTLTLPLSVNMIDAFMANVAGQNILLPLKNVIETRLLEKSQIASEAGRQVIAFNGSPVPITRLSDILGIKSQDDDNQELKAVFIKNDMDIMALTVDGYKGIKKILLKSLKGELKKIRSINAATILENGDPAFVLDIADIFERIKGVPAKISAPSAACISSKVLVVDDSLTTRTLIEGILKCEGYGVKLAQSGEEALQILDKDSFGLAVVDIEMPGMNGFELSAKIRQSPKDGETPIIILSSLASDRDKHKGIEVGANAYIVKGAFDQTTFLETVEGLV